MKPERKTTPSIESTTDSLRAQLTRLKLSYLLEHFESLAQQAGAEQWSHVEYLARLIEGEAHRREDRSIQRRIGLARFPYSRPSINSTGAGRRRSTDPRSRICSA